MSAVLREYSKQLEGELFGEQTEPQKAGGGFWLRQRDGDGQSVLNAASSRNQGAILDGVVALIFDAAGRFQERIEARSAELETGHWGLKGAAGYTAGVPPPPARPPAAPARFVPAGHQPHPGAGAGELCDAGNRLILVSARVHRA